MAIAKLSNLEQRKQEILDIKDNRLYVISKRVFDVISAGFGLIILSPIFLIVAILIKVEDRKGKVFFKQKRVGLHGQLFTMYKFRSMVSDAEDLLEDLLDKNEASGAMFKIKDDPRVTSLGRLLRKTSIDELPQLWNVVRGEMSLVGPRPPLPREVKSYTNYHKQRLLVKPGCTGLWQVSGRSNIGFEEMVELDFIYISKRSLMYDIQLIFKTLFMLLGSKDAY